MCVMIIWGENLLVLAQVGVLAELSPGLLWPSKPGKVFSPHVLAEGLLS